MDEALEPQPEHSGTQTATLSRPEPNQLTLAEIAGEPDLLELAAAGRLDEVESFLEANYLLAPNTFQTEWEQTIGESLELEADDWAKRLAKFLQGYRKDGPPTTALEEIPIYELHCPAMPQCETSGELATSKDRTVDMSLALSGIELGGSRKYRCEGKVKEYASETCCTIYMEVVVTYQRWNVKNNPKARHLRTLVDIRQADNGNFASRPEIGGAHHCRKFSGALPDFNARSSWRSKRISRSTSGADGHVSGEMPGSDQASTFNFQIKLAPPWPAGETAAGAVGLKFSLETRIESGLKLAYDLRGHCQYVAFDRVFGGGPVYWLWRNLDEKSRSFGLGGDVF